MPSNAQHVDARIDLKRVWCPFMRERSGGRRRRRRTEVALDVAREVIQSAAGGIVVVGRRRAIWRVAAQTGASYSTADSRGERTTSSATTATRSVEIVNGIVQQSTNR